MAKTSNALTLSAIKSLESMPVMAPSEMVADQGIESPFIFFCHPLSEQAWTMLTKSVSNPEKGMPYLVTQEGSYYVHPMYFCPIQLKQLWVQTDKTQGGKVMACTDQKPTDMKNWEENIESVLCLFNSTKAVLCRCSFKKGKTQGLKTVIRCLQEMEQDISKWLKISAEHRLTEKISDNRFKLVVEMHTKEAVAKGNGLPYNFTTSKIHPMKPTYFEPLVKYFNSTDFQTDLSTCMSGFNRRVKTLLNT